MVSGDDRPVDERQNTQMNYVIVAVLIVGVFTILAGVLWLVEVVMRRFGLLH